MINWLWTLSLDQTFIPHFHQQRLTTVRREVQLNTPFCSTKKKKGTLFFLQKHQSLRVSPCNRWEVVHLEQEKKMFLIMFTEVCFNKYYRVCVLIKSIITGFFFITNFFKNVSDMCETKEVLVSLSFILLVAASFCIYQDHTENKVGHHSKIKIKFLAKMCNKKYSLNGGDCYYLVDEDILGCNCIWISGGKRCRKYMWCD